MGHLCSSASDSPPSSAVSRTQCLRTVIRVESKPRLAQDSCGQGQQAAGGGVGVHLCLSAILPWPMLTQGYDL